MPSLYLLSPASFLHVRLLLRVQRPGQKIRGFLCEKQKPVKWLEVTGVESETDKVGHWPRIIRDPPIIEPSVPVKALAPRVVLGGGMEGAREAQQTGPAFNLI